MYIIFAPEESRPWKYILFSILKSQSPGSVHILFSELETQSPGSDHCTCMYHGHSACIMSYSARLRAAGPPTAISPSSSSSHPCLFCFYFSKLKLLTPLPPSTRRDIYDSSHFTKTSNFTVVLSNCQCAYTTLIMRPDAMTSFHRYLIFTLKIVKTHVLKSMSITFPVVLATQIDC